MTKRAGILVLNDENGIVDNYILHLAEKLNRFDTTLYVVCRGENAETEKLQPYTKHIIDGTECKTEAAAFKTVITGSIGRDGLQQYDELLLLDDSFFGPFCSFEDLFEKAEQANPKAAFWGLSFQNENQKELEYCKYHYRPWYVQTYFLVIRTSLAHSTDFWDFWDDMEDFEDERMALEQYIYTFTKHFSDLGYEPLALYDITEYDTTDNTVYNSLAILRQGFPLLRKKALLISYDQVIARNIGSQATKSLEYVAENTDYPMDLIYDHIIRKKDPYELFCTLNLNFILSDTQSRKPGQRTEKRTAFIMYLNEEAFFETHLRRLNELPEYIDVYITTDSYEKADAIHSLLPACSRLNGRVQVLASIGNGGKLGGLLVEMRPRLKDYTYIGFTHDRTAFDEGITAHQTNQDIIWENIAGSAVYVENVLSVLEDHPRIGFLTAPDPEYGRYFNAVTKGWSGNYNAFCSLMELLEIPMNAKASSHPLSRSAAFWCRYDALSALFEHNWEHSDFPDDPLPPNDTLLHAIDYGFPYIAKHSGYCSGMVYTTDFASLYLLNKGYADAVLFSTINKYVKMDNAELPKYKKQVVKSYKKAAANRWYHVLKQKAKVLKKKIRVIQRSKFFDKKWYLEQHPELNDMQCSPAEHYLTDGWKKGYDPSEEFSTSEYFKLNPGVKRAKVNPLLHYETRGILENRLYKLDPGGYKPLSFWRGIKRKAAGILCRKDISADRNARILVILHLFYMSSWVEIREYLKNLQAYQYDLVVTYTDAVVDEAVLDQIRTFKPGVTLRQCENVGYDVIPYLEVLKSVDLDQYDVIFKLQSKGLKRRQLFMYDQYFRKRDWFLNLFEGCIGAFTVHRTIRTLMDPNNRIGIMAAKNLLVVDPQHKQNMVRAYMQENNIPVPDQYMYVAGTCFAMRASLAKPLTKLTYDIEEMRTTGRGFSVAHKLERIICLSVFNDGYTLDGNEVRRVRRALLNHAPYAQEARRYSYLPLLKDDRFRLDDEFVYFSLETKRIDHYELVNIPLKTITRRWMRKEIPLTSCHPYRYLVTGDPAVYEEYCRLNQKYYNLDIMSRERFDELIRSMDEKGFDEKNVIVVDQDNCIMDGQHRCCYLMYRNGIDYEVPVLRIYKAGSRTIKARVKDFLGRHLSAVSLDKVLRTYAAIKGRLLKIGQ